MTDLLRGLALRVYVKLFTSILQSSVWAESAPTRLVWISMLALADPKGHVRSSLSGLARAANVSAHECRNAVETLSSPDPDSGSPEYDGRRIEKVEGGWNLLNYTKYREIRTEEQLKAAARARKYYHKNRDTSRTSQETSRTSRTEAETEIEANAEEEAKNNNLVGQQPDVGKTLVLVEPWATVADRIRLSVNGKQSDLHAAGKLVLSYFNASMQTNFRWGSKVQEKIISRLRETKNVSDLFYTVDGATRDDTIMGRRADSPPDGYRRPSTVFRDAEQVERLRSLARDRQPVHPILDEMLRSAEAP